MGGGAVSTGSGSSFLGGSVSADNSSTSALAADATFTGEWELNPYPDVMVSVKASHDGTLYMDFSNDGVTAHFTATYAYDSTGSFAQTHVYVKGSRYYRTRFTNGSTLQTSFSLFTGYGRFDKLTSPLNGTIPETGDCSIVRDPNNTLDLARGKVGGRSAILKFGRNPDIGTSSETVWAYGGDYTFPAAAQTLDVVSSSADDDGDPGAGEVTIYGLDANYAEISEAVTLTGQTPVTTTASFLRVYRAIVTSGTAVNVGNITIDQTTSGTVVGYIGAGLGQTELAIYTVPAGKTAYLMNVTVGASKGATAAVDVDMFVRPFGEVFQIKGTYNAATDGAMTVVPYAVPRAFTEKSDIYFQAVSTKVSTQVAVEFELILIDD